MIDRIIDLIIPATFILVPFLLRVINRSKWRE